MTEVEMVGQNKRREEEKGERSKSLSRKSGMLFSVQGHYEEHGTQEIKPQSLVSSGMMSRTHELMQLAVPGSNDCTHGVIYFSRRLHLGGGCCLQGFIGGDGAKIAGWRQKVTTTCMWALD